MDERLAFTHPGRDWRGSRRGIAFSERGIGWWNPASGDGTGSLAVDEGHEAERCSAQPHRLFEHCLEYRREITGRGIDDLQHLGGRGLLRDCFVALSGYGFYLSCSLIQLAAQIGDVLRRIGRSIVEHHG